MDPTDCRYPERPELARSSRASARQLRSSSRRRATMRTSCWSTTGSSWGNNALLAQAIGATEPEPFAGIGVRPRLPEISPEDLRARVREATGGREPLAFLDDA